MVEAATREIFERNGKKKHSRRQRNREEKVIEKPKDYAIDAEIGQLEIHTFETKKRITKSI